MDKLGSKIGVKLIHKLHYLSRGFHTDLERVKKILVFKRLGVFSTEIAKTITTSF